MFTESAKHHFNEKIGFQTRPLVENRPYIENDEKIPELRRKKFSKKELKNVGIKVRPLFLGYKHNPKDFD